MNQTKRFITLIFTLGVIGLMLFSKANALQVLLRTESNTYSQNEIIRFQVSIDISQGERLKIDNLQLDITNISDDLFKECIFDVNGNPVSGCENMVITPINREGYGYGYLVGDSKIGYGYGYQYGYFGFNGEVTYEVAWNISADLVPEGNYTSILRLTSGSRKYSSEPWHFSIIYLDKENPSLSFISPKEGDVIRTRNVTIELNVSDNVGLKRVWVNSLAWGAVEIDYNGPFNISIPDGNHTVYAYAYDLSNNINWTNVTFTVDAKDRIAPSIRIISPEERNYTDSMIEVNIEANDTNLDSIWYYHDGRTYPYTGVETKNFTYGSHLLLAFANDTEGNVNSTGVRFFVDIPYCVDFDNDGYYAIMSSCANGTDCNDRNSNIHPDAQEVCNGLDDNCDTLVDNIPVESIPLCPLQSGVCAGSKATCQGVTGWVCNYGPNYNPVETCSDNLDNNCNGEVNEGCGVCTTGQTRSCGLTDTGACSLGTQSCVNGQWGACIGAIYPVSEVCGDYVDNDCDGLIDENCGTNYVCTNGATRSCGTSDVGACKYGTQTCVNGQWGSCQGNVEPVSEICGNNIDDDCDGSVDESCTSGGGTITYYIPSSGSGANVCFTNWQCSDWSACSDGIQKRTCVDKNNCGKTFDKPAEVKSCKDNNVDLIVLEPSGTANKLLDKIADNTPEKILQTKSGKISKTTLLATLLVLVVLYYVALLVVFLKKRKL